jgi:hypothetical protein
MDKINETAVYIDKKHQLFITMLGGKVINAITETKPT